MIGEADRCLKEYVAKFQDLYGYKFLSIIFHMLTHLAENVRQLGPLPSTSCMPFEDLNGQLKRLVHGTTHAVLQICSSLSQIVHLPVMIETLQGNTSNPKIFLGEKINRGLLLCLPVPWRCIASSNFSVFVLEGAKVVVFKQTAKAASRCHWFCPLYRAASLACA